MAKDSDTRVGGRFRVAVGLSILVSCLMLPAEARAAFPGSNGLISFIATDAGDPVPRYVQVMNGDGSGVRRLTPDRTEKHVTALAPDGTTVAFGCTCGGVFDIYVMNVDGRGRRNITPGRFGGNFPTFSPDGTQIAFDSRERTGDFEIYVMNVDGTGIRNVTNDPNTDDVGPSWSPDGSRLVFHKATPDPDSFLADSDLHVMNLDGTGLQQVTSGITGAGDPDWSPDGESIVFSNNVCFPCDQSDIFVIDADGSDLRQITDNPDNGARPAWSPDGTRIVFQQWAPGSDFADIFTMDPYGGDLVNLTRTPDIGEGGADWGPTP